MLTSLMPGRTNIERTETTISSLMDTWIVLANDQVGARHRRGLYVLKSRGMSHSNELCEFVMTNHGLSLRDAASAAPGTANAVDDGSRKGRDRHAAV
jgi:circadian clock protein KaiC